MILKERSHTHSSKLWILSQLAVLPTCKAFCGPDPKTLIAGDEQAPNLVTGELLTRWRPPRDASNAVKSKQSELGAEPEITVGRLGNGKDRSFADRPRIVRILIDVERRF
jgi:hypothetical protein